MAVSDQRGFRYGHANDLTFVRNPCVQCGHYCTNTPHMHEASGVTDRYDLWRGSLALDSRHPGEIMSYAMERGSRTHRITADEFQRMAKVGLLAPNARVELVEGVIVDMAPIRTVHASD